MRKVAVNCLMFACVAVVHVRSEVFTSMAHLEAALYAERDIASALRSHVQKERERLDVIEKLAEDYADHSRKALADPGHYLGNPVNAFLLIKRFTLDWNRDMAPVLTNNSWQELQRELDYARQDLPKSEDLTGAAQALMRLQDTYSLDTASIARGNIGGVPSSTLSVEECFQLGRLSYTAEDFYHTVLWMEEAMSQLPNSPSFPDSPPSIPLDVSPDSPATRAELLDYLAFSYYKQGHTKHALTLTNQLLDLDPDHERAWSNKKYYEDSLQRQGESIDDQGEQEDGRAVVERPVMQKPSGQYEQSDEYFNYSALCRGDYTQKQRGQHRLKCRYVHNNHPLLLLQPAKEEEMYLKPWIVMYHDVLSEREMADIKMMATPRLNRATVQNPQTGKLETASYRISKSAWLRETDHPTVHKVNERIEAITGLEIDTAEELQVANYGMGGHYEPHYDFAQADEDAFTSLGTGNRIATFLSYMSDVEAGGATVFTELGLRLLPKKGAAAFWYNLYRSGDGIMSTRHAACPVLVGVKWVANKWIHERGQEFRRPCDLSPKL